MSSEAVGQTMLIVGTSGVGKSNGRVNWIVRDFLSDPLNGAVVTNLPLDLEAIKEYYDGLFARGKSSVTGADVVDRIVLIPRRTLELWTKEREDPFKFFETVSHKRFRVVLDEISDYYSVNHSKQWQNVWQNFLDQVRHIGDAGVELITQTADKLPRSLRTSVEVRIDCIGCKVRRDGLFEIVYYDWYQIKAVLTGQVVLSCFNIEMINLGAGNFKKNGERKVLLDQESFRFYNSHGAVEGSKKESESEVPPFKRHGSLGTLLWFVKKNKWNIVFSKGMLIFLMTLSLRYFSLGDAFGLLTNRMREASGKELPEKIPLQKAEAVEVPVVVATPAPVVERVSVTRLIDDSGAMIDGIYYELQEEIEFGSQRGEVIASVDVSRGVARLGNGHVLRMQERTPGEAPAPGSNDASLRGVSGSSKTAGSIGDRITSGLGIGG